MILVSHRMRSTPRLWGWTLAIVALLAYLIAGTHLACADTPSHGGHGSASPVSPVFVADYDDESPSDLHAAHCHVAHMQGSEAVASILPAPAALAVPLSGIEQRLASTDPPRAERPPRS
jgi:hypothetical protein